MQRRAVGRRYVIHAPFAAEMLPFPAAREHLFAALTTLPSERISLHTAHGRTLAVDIRAVSDLVPFARSAMDGFAVRACDVVRLPLTLAVVQSIFAKHGDDMHCPGTATAIATGAPLPHGADAVIPIELVAVRGTTIRITTPVQPNDNVFPPAQDACRGDLLIAAGERLGPGALALLAADGHGTVNVQRRARVAIVCTGDELIETQVQPLRGQVRNSNGIMLAAMAAECDAEIVAQCTLPDDLDTLAEAFKHLLPDVDALVVTGGASRGPRDFVKAALDRLGARWLFRSVAIRPGRPTGIACVNGTPVFALPGNPAAAFVAASTFVQPALRRIAGRRRALLPALHARLIRDVRAKADRHSFVFARLEYGDTLDVFPLDNQCSSLTRTPAHANALVVIEPGECRIPAGEMIAVLPLRWHSDY